MNDDLDLLERLRAGDEAAFTQLVVAHQVTFVRLARSSVRDEAASEDKPRVSPSALEIFRKWKNATHALRATALVAGVLMLALFGVTVLSARARRRSDRSPRGTPPDHRVCAATSQRTA